MLNFLFFSFQDDLRIRYVKSTLKFDNHGEGLVSSSFKIWLEKEELSILPEIYLLIRNEENSVILRMIDGKYNRFLLDNRFRETAGIEDTKKEKVYNTHTVGRITQFEEDEDLIKEKIIIPKKICIKEVNSEILANEISECIGFDDILIMVAPIDEETRKNVVTEPEENHIFEFQFRVFLQGFPSKETLESWKSSSESWTLSVAINGKENGTYNIGGCLNELLKFPKILDLWIIIPHNHLFIASSPVYKSAFKLKPKDIQYKTYVMYGEHEREFYTKFTTMGGDYAVKLGTSAFESQTLYSVVCVSPFLPEEEPRKLRRDIDEFLERSEKIEETQENLLKRIERSQRDLSRNIISIFGIFVAIFSFITISANYAMRIQLPEGDFSHWEVFFRVSALLLPVFLFLMILLLSSILLTRK